jgi:hypothetical protein
MLNRTESLVNGLGEEGAEVAQIASKINRFGMQEVFPGQPLTNAQRAHRELDDIWAMVELLNEESGFGYTPNRENIEAKKAKFNKFYAYSQSLGCAEPAQSAI